MRHDRLPHWQSLMGPLNQPLNNSQRVMIAAKWGLKRKDKQLGKVLTMLRKQQKLLPASGKRDSGSSGSQQVRVKV